MKSKKKELTKSEKAEHRRNNRQMILAVLSGLSVGFCFMLAIPFVAIADYLSKLQWPLLTAFFLVFALSIFVPSVVYYAWIMSHVMVEGVEEYLK